MIDLRFIGSAVALAAATWWPGAALGADPEEILETRGEIETGPEADDDRESLFEAETAGGEPQWKAAFEASFETGYSSNPSRRDGGEADGWIAPGAALSVSRKNDATGRSVAFSVSSGLTDYFEDHAGDGSDVQFAARLGAAPPGKKTSFSASLTTGLYFSEAYKEHEATDYRIQLGMSRKLITEGRFKGTNFSIDAIGTISDPSFLSSAAGSARMRARYNVSDRLWVDLTPSVSLRHYPKFFNASFAERSRTDVEGALALKATRKLTDEVTLSLGASLRARDSTSDPRDYGAFDAPLSLTIEKAL